MKQKPKRKKSVIVRLIVLGVAVYMVATLINRGNELAEYRAQLAELEKQRDLEKIQIEELKALLDSDSHSQ